MIANSFRELIVWQKAMELVEIVYKTTKDYPRDELYILVSQMRRAVLSVPSNIAEGFVRKHQKEFKNFLSIALGSLAELETQVDLSKRLGFITKEMQFDLNEKTDHLGRSITRLRQSLK